MPATKPLRLLVDLTKLLAGGEGGGIKPAILTMLRWLGSHESKPVQFVYLASSSAYPEIIDLARPVDSVITATSDQADLAAQHQCDIVYCPFGITEYACPGIPTIVLIVDLLHRDFPYTLPEPDRIYREQSFQRTIVVSDRFQVISNYTAAQFQESYKIPSSRIFRTYLPVHDRLTSRAVEPPPEGLEPGKPYFFYPANSWVHKNHDTLLVAYAMYRHAVASNAWPLVLSGHDDSRMSRLKHKACTLKIDADVRFVGYVPESKLAALYRHAGALVFPSLHEGFGIPLLEAMAFGTPILASDATAIPEITGPAALRVDARQPALLAAALERMTADPSLRASLVALGREQLTKFSAETEFNEFMEAIIACSTSPARWRHSGYYPVDGLTDPIAIFALPPVAGEVIIALSFRPLPMTRRLLIGCGPELLAERTMPANKSESFTLKFLPQARAITLRVPDACSLSPTDPRTHGVLLETLRAQTSDGAWHDLLASESV